MAIDGSCANESEYYQYRDYHNHPYTLPQLDDKQTEAVEVRFQLIKRKGKENNKLPSCMEFFKEVIIFQHLTLINMKVFF